MADDIRFENASGAGYGTETSVTETEPPKSANQTYPKAIIPVAEQTLQDFTNWLNLWLNTLESSHNAKLKQWREEETSYRAKSEGPQSHPYKGACGDVVPAIAMAVDPIHARLDTGIFKADPVFRIKPIADAMAGKTDALERWVEYYQKHKMQLRKVSAPRTLELAKHGTMVLKVIYDKQEFNVLTYDEDWKVKKTKVNRFQGPRIVGVPIQDFMFPSYYQDVQDCPIIAERQWLTYGELRKAEQSGKLTGCEKIKSNQISNRDELSLEQQISANHEQPTREFDQYELWECWCDYDIDGDGIPESLVATYHRNTKTLLQLRYNYFHHQKKPYVVIPYAVTNGSLYGLGIAEMVKPFQDMLTKWQRMATDNAYLANIRMWATKKDSGLNEASLTMYAGRNLPVDDPQKDIKELRLSDQYPSSLAERQNLFGLSEKRTGVSDYLTGRESPIIGSRATATSTVALIQEGTRRVEEVMENLRNGYAEAQELCFYLWIQYGTGDLESTVFGAESQTTADIKSFFDSVKLENLYGQLSFDLSATDASSNRSVQQQMQLAIIQVMMNYLEKLVQTAQLAFQASQQLPQLTEFIGEVTTSARKMFHDLLEKYDIRNPDAYLPDLEKFLAGISAAAASGGPGQVPGSTGEPGGPGGESGMADLQSPGGGFSIPTPQASNGGGTGIPPMLASLSGSQGFVPGA